MSILWLGGFSRYNTSTVPGVLPTTRLAQAFPNMYKLRLRTNGSGCGWRVSTMTNVLENISRNWLQIEATTSRTAISSMYYELGLFSRDIPEEYRKVNTVICVGFRYRAQKTNNKSSYLAFGNLTAADNINTAVGSKLTNIVYPLVANNLHPLELAASQEKYIEFRVRFRENNIVLIKMFVNKDLVFEKQVTWDEEWAMLCGNIQGSAHWFHTQSSTNAMTHRGSCFFNDFYVGVDQEGDKEEPTGLAGPLTVKPLDLAEPVINGQWETSVEGKTVQQVLTRKLDNNTQAISEDYVISDPGDRTAILSFIPPLEEKLKIVAFQQDFVAQQPLAYSTSLQYAQLVDGVSIEPGGKRTTINIALEPGIERVVIPAISATRDGDALTPDYLGKFALQINSVNKIIEDDVDLPPEEEVPPEEPIEPVV